MKKQGYKGGKSQRPISKPGKSGSRQVHNLLPKKPVKPGKAPKVQKG